MNCAGFYNTMAMEVDPPLLEKPQHVPVNFKNEGNNKDNIIYFSFATTGFEILG